jgi:hypothetical protein
MTDTNGVPDLILIQIRIRFLVSVPTVKYQAFFRIRNFLGLPVPDP